MEKKVRKEIDIRVTKTSIMVFASGEVIYSRRFAASSIDSGSFTIIVGDALEAVGDMFHAELAEAVSEMEGAS